jgi:O-acetyl-ADP-ribose deacetylase (regulator of RNase III)
VWVNPENTAMQMARPDEYSISGIIRYEGARRDEAGRIVADTIADELRRLVGTGPVAPGIAVATGPGALAESNGVRFVVHVAAVQGEPGAGFRQVREVGRCVTNALAMSAKLGDGQPVHSILFPLLGTGFGGGDLVDTVRILLGAATDHLATAPGGATGHVYFLAYTDAELAACLAAIDADARLAPTG